MNSKPCPTVCFPFQKGFEVPRQQNIKGSIKVFNRPKKLKRLYTPLYSLLSNGSNPLTERGLCGWTGFERLLPDGTRYANTPARDRFLTGKYTSGTHLEAEASQGLRDRIFNKTYLMLKICYYALSAGELKTKSERVLKNKSGFRMSNSRKPNCRLHYRDYRS